MSSIVVQVGQCGNQVGEKFWDYALKYTDSFVYTRADGKARSVNIDAEPKAVRGILRNIKKSHFKESNIILGKRGCGTNWAIGYNGFKSGDNLMEIALERIRKEIEGCDSFSGIIMMHSLSGGTGSGLGSHLTEALRDEYTMNYILSTVVAPHISGESPLQHYNAMLTMSHLQNYSDSVVLFQNDEVLHTLLRRSPDGADARIAYSNMNDYIASALCGIIMPTDSLTSKGCVSIGMEPWEMIRSICPMPSVKFCSIHQAKTKKGNLDSLLTSITRCTSRYDENNLPYSTIGAVGVMRGDTTGLFTSQFSKLETRLKSIYHCVDWNPYPFDFWLSKHNFIGSKSSPTCSLTVAANSSNVIDYVKHIISQAKLKYSAKAFIHWYWKHGLVESDFEEAFTTLGGIVDGYLDAVA